MKILNNIRWVLFFSAAMMISQGCESILDVEPESEIGDSQFWQTEADAYAGVASIYDAMQSAYSRKYFLWGEMRSDNFDAFANTSSQEAIELTTNNLTDQTSSYGSWGAMYNMILRANLAINNIPNITGANTDGVLGQAHALRAFAYFDLVRVFGEVPLYLDMVSGLDDDLFREKTSGSEIMNNIVIPDMLKAEDLINAPSDRFNFSLSSVYCLQAEVYMHLGEHTLAKEALDKLEALGEFSLVDNPSDYHALFRKEPESAGLSSNEQETGPELIFSIVFNQEEEPGAGSIYSLFWSGVPAYVVSDELENKWLDVFPTDSASWMAKYPGFVPPYINAATGERIYGDIHRYLQFIEGDKDIGSRRYGKYNTTNYPGSLDDVDVVVYRYAGMLLLKAEVEAKLGNLQEAVDLVNRIRNARQLPEILLADYPTTDDLLDAILDERQFELLAEGKRWWDLVRNDKVVEVMGPINGQTANNIFFPIWFQHMVDNPNLTQTPGYGN
ncbi:RagB/SusD family nutrient uptake outer membrane protein [Reichenbachiella ulvae]|uniref:RagB/SusD family nutrient uptake outer membrane protein n=1 Tax=Reichenbachiella ulvae TaxID=2980104 RepID=A0ABT3CSK5_9BACT|nr:RagB/SusD family nutrient uptake outer membrane protein [Reichenbachiella ulvae]MCV9386695.1 RagB/SusD family nutrient uptake outer membrane protein [Reichenbachiella ulvae]